MKRSHRRLVVGIVCAAAFVLSVAGSAVLADTAVALKYRLVASWGKEGHKAGKFIDPVGIAVSPANGSVYVADTGNNRVQRFTSGGRFMKAWGSFGGGAGKFATPMGIACGGDGSVYVAQYSGWYDTQKFSAAGKYLGATPRDWPQYPDSAWGCGMDGAGRLHVVQSDGLIKVYNTNLAYVSVWPDYGVLCRSRNIAFDKSGTAYVTQEGSPAEGIPAGVAKFSSAGAPTMWLKAGKRVFLKPTGIACDRRGHVFVADGDRVRVYVFNTEGKLLTTIGPSFPGTSGYGRSWRLPQGLAVTRSGNLYVVDQWGSWVGKFSPVD